MNDCLLALTELGGAERPEYLALWYHNAASTGTRGHHAEASSAVAATELLGVGLPWVEVGLIARLVLVTADHQARPDLPGADRVSDADLASLAGSFERVEASFQARRAEMIELDLADTDQWLRTWIEGMLAREHLFHTERGRDLWEDQARENLQLLLHSPASA